MKRSITILIVFLVFWATGSQAQIVDPVHWSTELKMTGDAQCEVVMTASIDAGWHMYSLDVDPDIGPQPLAIEWTALDGVELKGHPKADKTPHKEYDEMFGANLSWWTEGVTITQAFTATKSKFAIEGLIRYSACNNDNCIPPAKESFSMAGNAKIASAPAETPVDTVVTDTVAAAPVVASKAEISDADLWAPVDTTSSDDTTDYSTTSLWYIFIACFAGGFLALLTPCVWPMIPMTVSFFLKKKNRARAVADAMTYGLSIIVIYVALGILVTAIWGPAKLNDLATSATCNIIFFILLIIFAISFFGAFDIKLPSKWANKMDATADKTTGLLSIFFMAFTLTLVSFSCTGPIIGTLLVEAASTGDKFGPAIGMAGFALALAIPFCLFALFPSWLQSAPKSGSWMNTVKVVLGFLELALSLKFLSVADLAYGWRILDREVFLSLWIVLFVLLGLYLLGKLRFSHDSPSDHTPVSRFFLALASLAFAVYLVPGLWGAPLKAVSAFAPPLYTQDFNLYGGEFRHYDDYEQGMAAAAAEGKPVLVDFSGYACVNCRKMEGAVFDTPAVRGILERDYVMIVLMVDDKTALPQPMTVEENGRTVVLETVGEKWSYLQRHKFGTNQQPFYILLDNEGKPLEAPRAHDENVGAFVGWLETGVQNYKNL